MTVLARAQVVLEGDNTELTASLAQAQASMANAGRQMTRLGTELSILVTLPIVAIGKASAQSAADFDAAMRKVTALTDTSAKQVGMWTGQVRDLAQQYGVTGKEAADALYFISSAGVHGAAAMEALTAVLKGNAVGLGTTDVLAHAATSAMNAYAKSGMTATRALEILAGGIKSSNFSVAELAPNLGRVTGMAAALKIPLTDVVGTLAVFGHTGTEASEATTQLSSVLSTLLGHSVDATKALAAHGLTLAMLRKEAAGPAGLVGVMRTLNQAMGGQVDQLKLVIPNLRAFRGVMNALAQDATFVDRVLYDTAHSQGLLDKAFEESQGPAFRMKQSLAQLSDAGISLGNVLLPTIVPALQSFTEEAHKLADRLNSLSPETKGLVTMMLGLAAAIGPAVLVIGTLRWALGGLPLVALFTPATSLAAAFRSIAVGAIAAASSIAFQFTAAIGAASIAGTGLTGVLWGLRPAAMAAATALAPLVANAVIVAGLGLILVKWMEMKVVVEQTAAVLQLAAERQKQMFQFVGTTAENAQKEIDRLNVRIAALRKVQSEPGHDTTANAEYIDELNRMVAGLQKVVEAERLRRAATKASSDSGEGSNVWMQEASKILQKLAADLALAKVKAYQLPGTFNLGKEQATLYEEALKKLTEAGIPLNVALDAQGTTLQSLITRFAEATKTGNAFKNTQEEMDKVLRDAKSIYESSQTTHERYLQDQLKIIVAASKGTLTLEQMKEALQHLKEVFDESNDAFRNAKAIVEQSMTPQQRYKAGIDALDIALRQGKITTDEYAQAVVYLKTVLDGGVDNAHALKNALIDIGSRGLDALVEMALTGKNTFGDFVKSAIADITKLIVKMEIMKLVFPKGIQGGSIFKDILGFADGGFLSGGSLGIVGENGPELVMAGNRGMTVAPFVQAEGTSGGGGGGDVIHVHNHVNAVDARGVSDFFLNNENLVAGAMLRAHQKSRVLQRALGK